MQHLHRQHARAPRPWAGRSPKACRGRARAFVREAGEMPGRGDRGDAARPAQLRPRRAPSSRRGNSRPDRRARRAPPSAAAGSARHGRRRTVSRRSGAGQPQSSSSTPPPCAGQPAQQRALAHVEHVGRIDQRGHEQDRRARRRHNRATPRRAPRDRRHRRRRRRRARPPDICLQARQRRLHPRRICCALLAQHLQEQRERPGPMLRCGKLWC